MTYEQIIEAWNTNADEFNQWGSLSEAEKIGFALDAQRLEFVEFLREQHRKRDQIGENIFLVAANKYEAMKGPQ